MLLWHKLRSLIIKEEKGNFNKIANEWLEYKRNSIKESTYYNYMFIIEKYLNSQFSNIKLERITNYNDFTQELLQKLSPKTVRDIILVLKSILRYYEEEYGCTLRYKKIGIPKVEKSYIKILSNKEKNKIERYCLENATLKALGIIVCLNTGLRIGEICALKWENIDLEQKNIYVKKTLQRVYNQAKNESNIIIDNPKTECSIRTIPITQKLYKILLPLKRKYSDDRYFLTGSSEKFIEPRNYQYTFKSILEKSNVKSYKFHILRHTFATNCMEIGMETKALSEILGHSSVEITLNKYIHSSRKIKKYYLEKL